MVWRPTGAHGKDGQSPSLLGDEFCYTVLTAVLLGLQSLTKLLLSSFSLSDPGASPYLVLRSIFCPLFLKCFYQIILGGPTSSLPHLHSLDIVGHTELNLQGARLGSGWALMRFPEG